MHVNVISQGFVKLSWPRWKRVLFTRLIAITPTLAIAATNIGVEKLTGMNDILNALQVFSLQTYPFSTIIAQAMQLPFALVPVLTFSCCPRVMNDFATGL